MKTYQDFETIKDRPDELCNFVKQAVAEHKCSSQYKAAAIAEKYYAKHNVTIEAFQKVLYNLRGQAVPDVWSANYKLKTLFFRRFVIQQVQYVLSNGVKFEKEQTEKALGADFDNVIQTIAKKAMVDGVCFGFWNKDHIEVFPLCDTPSQTGFAPLYDRETSALRAGIRYWYITIGRDVVTRYTLFEEDGITEFVEQKSEVKITEPKHGYLHTVSASEATGVVDEMWENYSGFPIIPMWANDLHTTELDGIRESIDCYDYIKSGLANDIDDTSGFYWVLKNTGGMDDVDLAQFMERMKTVRAAVVDSEEGVAAEAHTLDVPTEARSAMLALLKNDLYDDFQLLNTNDIASGDSQTATAIRAKYQPQDDKCGDFEFFIRDFIAKLLKLIGIDDTPSFQWNRIANQSEETQMVLSAAQYLDDETLLRHLPWLTFEEVDEIMKRKIAEESTRLAFTPPEDEAAENEENEAEEE